MPLNFHPGMNVAAENKLSFFLLVDTSIMAKTEITMHNLS
jgi:hypothetical protein